jgi:hypothetical protein
MNQELMFICLIAMALMVVIRWRQIASMEKKEKALIQMIMDLQKDNNILTEAITRRAGSPVIFTKPETRPSEGWFDGKKQVVLTSEKP